MKSYAVFKKKNRKVLNWKILSKFFVHSITNLCSENILYIKSVFIGVEKPPISVLCNMYIEFSSVLFESHKVLSFSVFFKQYFRNFKISPFFPVYWFSNKLPLLNDYDFMAYAMRLWHNDPVFVIVKWKKYKCLSDLCFWTLVKVFQRHHFFLKEINQ